jgi:hypothetical protein
MHRFFGAPAVLALAIALAACAPPQDESAEPGARGIADRTFIYRYDSGVEIKGRFEGEEQIHWEGLKGPAAGSKGSAPILAAEAAPGVWFVSWVEETDVTVSQTLDLENMSVVSFVTWPSPEGRQSNLDRGTLTEAAD